jgi:two-component system KDP operon response regulator KdpE
MFALTGREKVDDGTAEHRRGPRSRILAIEDDRHILRMLELSLAAAGYEVLQAPTGQRALEEARTRNPDLVLLDLGLPDVDGLSLVTELRKNTAAPIIVVSADHQQADKIKALDAGANDYLTKPFAIPELLARIRVGLRGWAHVEGSAHATVTFGDFTFDLQSRRLLKGRRQIRLSSVEVRLLATLARHANEIVTPNALLREAWGSAYAARTGYVRVYMHSLRRKIEKDPGRPQYLLNEIGLGYRLRTTDPGTENATSL